MSQGFSYDKMGTFVTGLQEQMQRILDEAGSRMDDIKKIDNSSKQALAQALERERQLNVKHTKLQGEKDEKVAEIEKLRALVLQKDKALREGSGGLAAEKAAFEEQLEMKEKAIKSLHSDVSRAQQRYRECTSKNDALSKQLAELQDAFEKLQEPETPRASDGFSELLTAVTALLLNLIQFD